MHPASIHVEGEGRGVRFNVDDLFAAHRALLDSQRHALGWWIGGSVAVTVVAVLFAGVVWWTAMGWRAEASHQLAVVRSELSEAQARERCRDQAERRVFASWEERQQFERQRTDWMRACLAKTLE